MIDRRHLDVVTGAPSSHPEEADTWLAFETDLTDETPPDADAVLYNAAGVRLETTRRVVDHDAGDRVYERGARVLCQTSPGATGPFADSGETASLVVGVVVVQSRRTLVKGTLPRIVRPESLDERVREAEFRAREQALYKTARQATAELGLALKVVRAESMHGGQGMVVYCASEERIQFRDLLSHLSQLTEERVELRQVGLRDASKVLGGVGPCGLQLCCNTFLSDFAPITIKMAKDQGLGVNPQKLAGLCGRLLCCLVYEEAYYRAQRQLVPRLGDRVGTDRGEGKVRDVDVPQMVVKVALDSGETVTRPLAELSRKS